MRTINSNPDVATSRGKFRTPEDASTFWGSPEFKRLQQATNGAVLRPTTSIYELGFDWVKVYNHRQHSVGIVGIRIADVDPITHAKWQSYHPVAIWPGPELPKDMAPYMSPLAEELATLAPDGPGMQLNDGIQAAFTHHVVISGIYCDTQARGKVAMSMMSAAAILGCYFCWLCGIRQNDQTLFLGYSEPTIASRGIFNGKSLRIGQDDVKRMLTHDAHMQRALYCERKKAGKSPADAQKVAACLGCHGESLLFSKVKYLHRANSWVLPFFHAAMLGVSKALLKIAIKGKKSDHNVNQFVLRDKRLLEKVEDNWILSGELDWGQLSALMGR